MNLHSYSRHYPKLIKLGLPILVSQLGMIVVAFADNIMVGRYSTPSLASASFVNSVFNIAILACIGFSYGLTPLMGALFTKGEKKSIGSMMRTGLVLNIAFALVLTGVMTVVYFNLSHLGQPEELLPLIRPYYLVVLAGVIPVAVFNAFAQWSYAITNSRMPMWIILSANLLNIIGNYALIYGHFGMPEMGLMGAGISTLISRIFCAVVIIAVYFRSHAYREYREGFTHSRFHRYEASKVFSTSWPVALQMSLETASFSLSAVMAGWIDALSLAALQIIIITGTLGFCIYYSLGTSIAVYVANACGSSDSRLPRQVAMSGYHIMLALMVMSSIVLALFGRNLIDAFSDDPAVLTLTYTLIFPLVLYQLCDATQITFANALRGTSHVKPMIWTAVISYIIIGLPATYLLAFTAGLGVYGIVLSYSVSLLSAALMFVYFFRKATA